MKMILVNNLQSADLSWSWTPRNLSLIVWGRVIFTCEQLPFFLLFSKTTLSLYACVKEECNFEIKRKVVFLLNGNLWDLLHANQNTHVKDTLLHGLCIYLCPYQITTVMAAIYFKDVPYIFSGLHWYSLKDAVTAWHQLSPCVETATFHQQSLPLGWASQALCKVTSPLRPYPPTLDRKVGPLHVFNPTFFQDTNIAAFNWLQFYRRVCPRCDCSKMKEHQCWAWMFPIQLPVAPSFYFESVFHLSMGFPNDSGNPGFFSLVFTGDL